MIYQGVSFAEAATAHCKDRHHCKQIPAQSGPKKNKKKKKKRSRRTEEQGGLSLFMGTARRRIVEFSCLCGGGGGLILIWWGHRRRGPGSGGGQWRRRRRRRREQRRHHRHLGDQLRELLEEEFSRFCWFWNWELKFGLVWIFQHNLHNHHKLLNTNLCLSDVLQIVARILIFDFGFHSTSNNVPGQCFIGLGHETCPNAQNECKRNTIKEYRRKPENKKELFTQSFFDWCFSLCDCMQVEERNPEQIIKKKTNQHKVFQRFEEMKNRIADK